MRLFLGSSLVPGAFLGAGPWPSTLALDFVAALGDSSLLYSSCSRISIGTRVINNALDGRSSKTAPKRHASFIPRGSGEIVVLSRGLIS